MLTIICPTEKTPAANNGRWPVSTPKRQPHANEQDPPAFEQQIAVPVHPRKNLPVRAWRSSAGSRLLIHENLEIDQPRRHDDEVARLQHDVLFGFALFQDFLHVQVESLLFPLGVHRRRARLSLWSCWRSRQSRRLSKSPGPAVRFSFICISKRAPGRAPGPKCKPGPTSRLARFSDNTTVALL